MFFITVSHIILNKKCSIHEQLISTRPFQLLIPKLKIPLKTQTGILAACTIQAQPNAPTINYFWSRDIFLGKRGPGQRLKLMKLKLSEVETKTENVS